MKLRINKKQFEKQLEHVVKALQNNSPLPALQGVVINATESNIQLTASNGNLSIKEIIVPSESIKVEEPGKALVPGTLFRNIIKKQGSEVILVSDDSTMIIESEGDKTSLQLLNVTEYPILSFESIGKELVVDGGSLQQLIKNVSYAAAENDKRIILNGVNLKSKGGYLSATATNSFRLAQEKIEVDSNSEFEITILSKNLKDFIPAGANGPLNISVNDSKIITKHNNTTVMSKLIDGVYPNVSGLIPNEFKTKIKVDAKSFSNIIDKATVLANDSNRVIRLTISEENIKIESKRREIGDSEVVTNDFKKQGDDIVIALNSQFLIDSLSKFTGDVVIALNGPHNPIIVKGESNKELTQLVLPHRSY